MNYLAVTLLLVCIQGIEKSCGSYYWRVYNRKIPSDAYSPGQDFDQQNIYIGQGLLLDEYPGLYPTTIYEGKDVHIAMVGVRLTNRYVQILCCSDPDNFEWIPTNATQLKGLRTKNEIVPGGLDRQEVDNRPLGIGRIKIQGETVVGKVMLEEKIPEWRNLWYVYTGTEKYSASYELLTYRNYQKPKGNETYPYILTTKLE